MAEKDFWTFTDDFFGTALFAATQDSNTGWRISIDAAAGTPTHVLVDGASSGELAVDMDTQAEAQNLCIYQGDILQYDIDKIREVEFRIKMNQAAADATTSFAFGVTGDRNDAIDSIAQTAIFRVVGADSTTNVVVETDDGTVEQNDTATGTTLINAYKEFKISFAEGTADVRFFIDGVPVATSTTFVMSNYTDSLQLFMQIQKTSDANANGFTVDRVSIRGVR